MYCQGFAINCVFVTVYHLSCYVTPNKTFSNYHVIKVKLFSSPQKIFPQYLPQQSPPAVIGSIHTEGGVTHDAKLL